MKKSKKVDWIQPLYPVLGWAVVLILFPNISFVRLFHLQNITGQYENAINVCIFVALTTYITALKPFRKPIHIACTIYDILTSQTDITYVEYHVVRHLKLTIKVQENHRWISSFVDSKCKHYYLRMTWPKNWLSISLDPPNSPRYKSFKEGVLEINFDEALSKSGELEITLYVEPIQYDMKSNSLSFKLLVGRSFIQKCRAFLFTSFSAADFVLIMVDQANITHHGQGTDIKTDNSQLTKRFIFKS